MHIIIQKCIWNARKKHPESKNALDVSNNTENQFKNFSELKRSFNSVDKVGSLTIFDFGGNKVRLITTVHFQRQKIYIRHVLTHKEYDKRIWK